MKRVFLILVLSGIVAGAQTNKLSSYPLLTSLGGSEVFPVFVPGVTNYSISALNLGAWLAGRISAQPPSANLSNWSLIPTNALQSGGGGGVSYNGTGLSNLNASALSTGTVPAARLSGANLVAALGFAPATNGVSIPLDIERAIPLNMRDVIYGGSRSAANQSGTLRWQIMPACNSHDVQLIYVNMYRPSGDFLAPNSNRVTLKAALEVNNKIYPAFFFGQRTNVLDPGGTAISDPIGCMVKTNDVVYVRTFFDAGSGGYIPTTHAFQGTSAGTGSDSLSYGVDLVDGGALSACSQPLSWGPVNVVAVPDSLSRVAVVLLGDSIIYGSGEAFQNSSTLWSVPWGFAARALQPASLGYVKLCVGSDTIGNWTNSGWMRIPSGKGATIALCNYGVNDLKAGISVSALQANLKSLWNYFAAKRLKVYQTTITPESTSTDGFTSLANQTTFAYEANRAGLNAWLRDSGPSGAVAQSGGILSGVFDVAAMVEAAGGKWAVTNGAYYSGTATGVGSNYLLDANQNTMVAHTLDYAAVIKITGGTGAGQVLTVTANSPANKYYVSSWTTQPDTTSTYEIWWVYTSDGEHPRSIGHAAMASAVNPSVFSWP